MLSTTTSIPPLTPRSRAVFTRAALNNLTSTSFFTAPPEQARDANYWRAVISTMSKSNSTSNNGVVPATDQYYRRNGAGQRNPTIKITAEEVLKQQLQQHSEQKDPFHTKTDLSHSAQTRAAGLLVDKEEDAFERKLTADLQNVKGIDLDGDGQIDDDELEFAKEMEARLIRSKAFYGKVIKHKCPWKWFGSKWEGVTKEQRIDMMFKDPHFDVSLDQMTTKLRNYTLCLSPRMHSMLSPRARKKIPTTKDRREKHEQLMYQETVKTQQLRIATARADPLSTQPQSYRQYLTKVNPVTGRYVFE